MVVSALESDAKSMTSVSHDGVDMTSQVISQVADILGPIELRFDFDSSQLDSGQEYDDNLDFIRLDLDSAQLGKDSTVLDSVELQEELTDFDSRLSSSIDSKEGEIEPQVSTEANFNQNLEETPDNFDTDFSYEIIPDPWLENTEHSQNVIQKSSQDINDYYPNETNFDVQIDPQTGLVVDPWLDNNLIPNNYGVNMENTTTTIDDELTDLTLDSTNELVDFDSQLASNQLSTNDIPDISQNEPTDIEIFTDNSVENQELIADGIYNFLELQETDFYETDNYIIQRNDGEIFINSKDDGSEVFHIDSSGSIESNLDSDETQKFVDFSALVNEKFHQTNVETTVSTSEVEYDLAESQVIADGIRNFLDIQEIDYYETDNYIIERNNGDISITAFDGRGEVFTVSRDGSIDNQFDFLEREELSNFSVKVDNIVNQKITEGIDNFLSSQETNTYEANNYLLHKSDDGEITITELDTGADLFRTDNSGNVIDANFTREETKNFLQFSHDVSKFMANNQLINSNVEKAKEESEQGL